MLDTPSGAVNSNGPAGLRLFSSLVSTTPAKSAQFSGRSCAEPSAAVQRRVVMSEPVPEVSPE